MTKENKKPQKEISNQNIKQVTTESKEEPTKEPNLTKDTEK